MPGGAFIDSFRSGLGSAARVAQRLVVVVLQTSSTLSFSSPACSCA
jgi:hypothetical protein